MDELKADWPWGHPGATQGPATAHQRWRPPSCRYKPNTAAFDRAVRSRRGPLLHRPAVGGGHPGHSDLFAPPELESCAQGPSAAHSPAREGPSRGQGGGRRAAPGPGTPGGPLSRGLTSTGERPFWTGFIRYPR
ncbi:unnamed protein product [Gadus morhua 'NCC']